MVRPAPGVRERGTVLMLHGFSACPQQYFELADILAAEGYRCMIALLPGHGRQRRAEGSDDASALPTGGDWRASFDDYAATLNAIMMHSEGERVLVGLSGGGAVALHMALSASQPYDRLLILAPFFDIAAPPWASAAIALAGSTPGLRSLDATPFGSEKPCLAKVAQGKASYCEWRLGHVRGMHALGASVARRLLDEPYSGRVQFVGVEGDRSVSIRRIRSVMLAHETSAASACVYPEGVPHSMFSRFDHPGEDMYWLDDFHASALAFIVDGRRFTHGETSSELAPLRLCRLRGPPRAGP
jgi:pimeloyl-ACP methyl ester carboxylesterase